MADRNPDDTRLEESPRTISIVFALGTSLALIGLAALLLISQSERLGGVVVLYGASYLGAAAWYIFSPVPKHRAMSSGVGTGLTSTLVFAGLLSFGLIFVPAFVCWLVSGTKEARAGGPVSFLAGAFLGFAVGSLALAV